MIWEVAHILVKPGAEIAFEQAVAEAAAIFRAARGCHGARLHRSIEQPQSYRLMVGWDSVDDHMVHFRAAPGFQQWRALAAPHFAAPPSVEHFATVVDGICCEP